MRQGRLVESSCCSCCHSHILRLDPHTVLVQFCSVVRLARYSKFEKVKFRGLLIVQVGMWGLWGVEWNGMEWKCTTRSPLLLLRPTELATEQPANDTTEKPTKSTRCHNPAATDTRRDTRHSPSQHTQGNHPLQHSTLLCHTDRLSTPPLNHPTLNQTAGASVNSARWPSMSCS